MAVSTFPNRELRGHETRFRPNDVRNGREQNGRGRRFSRSGSRMKNVSNAYFHPATIFLQRSLSCCTASLSQRAGFLEAMASSRIALLEVQEAFCSQAALVAASGITEQRVAGAPLWISSETFTE